MLRRLTQLIRKPSSTDVTVITTNYDLIIDREFRNEIRNHQVGSWNTCDCSEKLQLKTVLVPPSLVRDIRDPNLLQIWNSALEAIRVAHSLVFIGYSLPAEDLAIKSLIMRGMNGRKSTLPPLQVTVIQKGDDSKQNYLNLFGKTIDYDGCGLEQYLKRET